LCKAKKLIYVTTSGGPIISDDFGFGYIKSLAENFYGINDINYIKAEGLDIWGANIQEILEEAKKEIDKVL
jgi:FMN-dependent NADH-azoreductase